MLPYLNKLEYLALIFQPSLIFSVKTKVLAGLYSNVRLLALPANTRLGWELIVVINALAYYDTATESFIAQTIG